MVLHCKIPWSQMPTQVMFWNFTARVEGVGNLRHEGGGTHDTPACWQLSPHPPAWEGSSFRWKHPDPALKRKPQPTGSIVTHDLPVTPCSTPRDLR